MAAPPKSPLVSVEEYLNTPYDPDVEFVDGVLVKRNVGDWLHSLIQSNVLFALRQKYPHLKVVAELRSSVTRTRYRLPDVCILLAAPKTRYLLDTAYLVVEVLSEGDVMSVVIEKLKEYAGKGVQNIWLIDPRLQLMWKYGPPTLIEIEGECRNEGSARGFAGFQFQVRPGLGPSHVRAYETVRRFRVPVRGRILVRDPGRKLAPASTFDSMQTS